MPGNKRPFPLLPGSGSNVPGPGTLNSVVSQEKKPSDPMLLFPYRIQHTTHLYPCDDVFFLAHRQKSLGSLSHSLFKMTSPLSDGWSPHLVCARLTERLLRSALLGPLAGACRGSFTMFPWSVSQWLRDHSATHRQNKCCHIVDCCSCYRSCPSSCS